MTLSRLIITSQPKVMGGYGFAVVGRYIDIYDCEQLPGANSSPVIAITSSVIPLAIGNEVIKFWKVKVNGQGR